MGSKTLKMYSYSYTFPHDGMHYVFEGERFKLEIPPQFDFIAYFYPKDPDGAREYFRLCS